MPLSIRERLAKAWQHNRAAPVPGVADEARLAIKTAFLGSLFQRQSAGERTSIRKLHEVVGLDQREALQHLQQLEAIGLIQILTALHDEFESELILTEPAKRKLAQLLG